MKNLLVLTSLPWLWMMATSMPAQTAPSLTLPCGPEAAGGFVVQERGPDQRRWVQALREPTPFGRTVERRRQFVEVASGLHYWQEGQWRESEEVLEGVPGGALARRGPHRVFFANNLASAGAVALDTPDGRRLVSQPLCLGYYDRATGQQVMLGEVKDCQGVVQANQVLYADAFTGVRADVRYTYTRGGLEQDVILREQLPAPESFGLASASTRLQVYTEFVQAPAPQVRIQPVARADGTVAPDEELDFGVTRLVRGRAFGLGEQGRGSGVPVDKQWRTLEGRQFLIEQVPVPQVRRELEALPAPHGAGLGGSRAVERLAGALPPRRKPAAAGARPMQLARGPLPARGLVLDWQALNGTTGDFTFQGDTTYLVSGPFTVNGTLTIEGGAVIKFTNCPGVYGSAYVLANGPVDCRTRPYWPAVFTSQDDNSVGATLPGSTGNPDVGTYLGLATRNAPRTLSGLRFLHAWVAVQSGAGVTVADSQLVNCWTGLDLYGSSLTLRNVLFRDIHSVVLFDNCWGLTVTGEHVTADRFGTWLYVPASLSRLSLTNSLLTQGTNWVVNPNNGLIETNAVVWLADDAGVYQSVGGGRCYLAADSPYRGAGTTNLSAAMRERLRAGTTWPPVVYSNATLTSALTLAPQAPRDTGTPDLGYHYDPLDYAFGGVTSQAGLSVAAGTVAGWFRTSAGWQQAGHGIHLADGQRAEFAGTASAPAGWVRCDTVQEGATGAWAGGYGPGGITGWAVPYATNVPVVCARFTRASMLADDGVAANHFRDDWGRLVVQARDCEFRGGGLGGYVSTRALTNCLLERVSCWLEGGWDDLSLSLRNCTLRGGGLSINRWNPCGTPVSVRDCALDGAAVFSTDAYANNPALSDYDDNAFLAGAPRLAPAGSNDVVVTNYVWQSGGLGDAYQGLTNLINRGSQSADRAGLYHYTTQTNQVKETNSVVDIGFHYVALDADGNPVDTDGDGMPDYLEDTNGNGAVDSGETDWQNAADLGLKVRITVPRTGGGPLP